MLSATVSSTKLISSYRCVSCDMVEIFCKISCTVLPNYFLEAKAPKGGADVVKQQACYDGALGARAMHQLQSYREDQPVFDGDAYTLVSTYDARHSEAWHKLGIKIFLTWISLSRSSILHVCSVLGSAYSSPQR